MRTLEYRKDIGPHYPWVAEGIRKYLDHEATKVAIELTRELLPYIPRHDYSWERHLRTYTERLKFAGITELDVLARVAEFYAWTADHPARLPTPQAEDSALGRIVLYLAPLKRAEKRPGARVMRNLGSLLRDHCGLYAIRLLGKLRKDADRVAAMKRVIGSLE